MSRIRPQRLYQVPGDWLCGMSVKRLSYLPIVWTAPNMHYRPPDWQQMAGAATRRHWKNGREFVKLGLPFGKVSCSEQ